MKYQVLYENFIDAVKNSIPRNKKVSAVLTDILKIEKEAVYRRLRMEVPFTFTEIANVAQHLDISMDDLIDNNVSKNRPLYLRFIDYTDPMELGEVILENLLNLVKQLKAASDSEISFSCSTLPPLLYLNYEQITRFYLFKWTYMYGHATTVKRFEDLELPARLNQIRQEIVSESHSIRTTNYIADSMLFHSLLHDIQYFLSIQLLSEQDVQSLKQEIGQFIDDTENLAAQGHYPDTRQVVNFYVSNLNFETNYICAETPDMHISMMKAFILNVISSQDDLTFQRIKNWLQSLKRVSTLISQSGEQQRILYFSKQRELLQALSGPRSL